MVVIMMTEVGDYGDGGCGCIGDYVGNDGCDSDGTDIGGKVVLLMLVLLVMIVLDVVLDEHQALQNINYMVNSYLLDKIHLLKMIKYTSSDN